MPTSIDMQDTPSLTLSQRIKHYELKTSFDAKIQNKSNS